MPRAISTATINNANTTISPPNSPSPSLPSDQEDNPLPFSFSSAITSVQQVDPFKIDRWSISCLRTEYTHDDPTLPPFLRETELGRAKLIKYRELADKLATELTTRHESSHSLPSISSSTVYGSSIGGAVRASGAGLSSGDILDDIEPESGLFGMKHDHNQYSQSIHPGLTTVAGGMPAMQSDYHPHAAVSPWQLDAPINPALMHTSPPGSFRRSLDLRNDSITSTGEVRCFHPSMSSTTTVPPPSTPAIGGTHASSPSLRPSFPPIARATTSPFSRPISSTMPTLTTFGPTLPLSQPSIELNLLRTYLRLIAFHEAMPTQSDPVALIRFAFPVRSVADHVGGQEWINGDGGAAASEFPPILKGVVTEFKCWRSIKDVKGILAGLWGRIVRFGRMDVDGETKTEKRRSRGSEKEDLEGHTKTCADNNADDDNDDEDEKADDEEDDEEYDEDDDLSLTAPLIFDVDTWDLYADWRTALAEEDLQISVESGQVVGPEQVVKLRRDMLEKEGQAHGDLVNRFGCEFLELKLPPVQRG